MTKYLNTVEAAQQLGVTKQAVCKWFKKQRFPGAFKAEGAVRIPVEDVEALKHKPEVI